MFFKKKLTAMQVDLMNYGYTKNEKYNYVEKKVKIGTCDVHIAGSLAPKGTLIVYWNWGKEKNLEEKHHDEIWNKLGTLIPEIDSRFFLSSLGFEFISIMINENNFSSAQELNNLLDNFCKKMEELINPLLQNL